jgi:hypothetical protein
MLSDMMPIAPPAPDRPTPPEVPIEEIAHNDVDAMFN